MDTITLKNGEAVPAPVVSTTMIALEHLYTNDFITFYELVAICRDPQHTLYSGSGEKLVQMEMLQSADGSGNGRVHNLIKSIVLSSVEGEDLDMTLTSPIAG